MSGLYMTIAGTLFFFASITYFILIALSIHFSVEDSGKISANSYIAVEVHPIASAMFFYLGTLP